MPKAKTSTSPSDLTLHIDLSFEALMSLFAEIGSGVNKQLDAGTVEERSLAEVETQEAAMRALTEGEEREIVQRRDQIVEMLFAIEERAKRIRRTVQNAEALARRYEKFGKNLEQSIFLGMLNGNIEVIEGELHRFKLYRAPDRLEITDETAVPDEYRIPDEVMQLHFALAGAIGQLKCLRTMIGEMTDNENANPNQVNEHIAQLEKVLELNQGSFEINKDKLKEDLEAGKTILGCYLETDRKVLNVK